MRRRPGDRTDEQRTQDDEDGRSVAGGIGQDTVGDAHFRQPRHEQRRESETVGDDGARAIGEAVPHRHAEEGADDDDGGDVDDGPEAEEQGIHGGDSTTLGSELAEGLPRGPTDP